MVWGIKSCVGTGKIVCDGFSFINSKAIIQRENI